MTIAYIREANHFKKSDMARILGISRMVYDNWESGYTSIPAAGLLKLCEVFDLDPREVELPPINFKTYKR